MLLEIDDWRSVGDLQYRFNKCFPNLNLQIFDGNDLKHLSRPLPSGTLLQHLRKVHSPEVLSIKSWYTKKEVERMLRDTCGLVAKIVPNQLGLEFPANENGQATLQELNEMVDLWQHRFNKEEETGELVESY